MYKVQETGFGEQDERLRDVCWGSDKYRILINLHMMNGLYNESRPRDQVQDGREGYAKVYFLTIF